MEKGMASLKGRTEMTYKVASDNIEDLGNREIIVFGSNIRGIHGKGAAKQALKWGAEAGKGEGLSGFTYAIPTKKDPYNTLPLNIIKLFVDQFIKFAANRPYLKFLVTKIGCGNAGYTPEDIAPMFADVGKKKLTNVYLPKEFIKVLTNINNDSKD